MPPVGGFIPEGPYSLFGDLICNSAGLYAIGGWPRNGANAWEWVYIGESKHVGDRVSISHEKFNDWYGYLRCIQVGLIPLPGVSQQGRKAIERVLILRERPRFNVQHNPNSLFRQTLGYR